MENISNFLSNSIVEAINTLLLTFDNVEEIRIRAEKPLVIRTGLEEIVSEYIVTTEDILTSLERICENSVYTYQNQICGGFITVTGGHRVGITGNAVMEEGRIININYISSLNFRIARQVIDCSRPLLNYIIDYDTNTVRNTLIVSPPGAGKTTILRDLVRNISNGFNGFRGLNVGLVDERGEIAAMYKGVAQNDIGIRTDVIDNVPKVMGIRLLVRSMAPQVIVADEIGGEEETETINYAVCSGVSGIFTAHGNSFNDLLLNPTLNELIKLNIIQRIVFLENKKIRNACYLNTKTMKYERFST